MRVGRSLVPFVLLLTASLPAAAQSIDGRFGLGIEVPALDIRHVSQDISVPSGTAGESTTTSVGQTSTAIGLFAIGAGLNGQYGLSNQTVLGTRLALRRETSKSDGTSTAAHSQLSLLPRFEYYMAHDDVVRPHIGLEAGYERSTTNGSSGVTSNLWLIGPTGGVSYFPSPNWSVDINASLYFVTGSEDIGGQSASASGYGGVLRVTLSSWLGANTSPRPSSEPTTGAQGNTQQSSTLAGSSSASIGTGAATGNPSTGATPSSNVNQGESSQSPSQPRKDTRLSLDLQEGRRLLLATNGTASSKKVKLTLMKAPYANELSSCRTVAIHAPKRDDVTVAVQYRRISAPSGDVTTLSAEIDVDSLKSLTMATVTTAVVLTPDHWIDVCGQHWPISPLGRRQLKEYLEGL